MAARDYGQYGGVTRGLELVGERWALLIVRDLLVGPRRYGELAAGLARIPSNILAARLKELQAAGVIRRVPHSRVIVYELTPYGRELEPVVLALGAWGFKALGEPDRQWPGQIALIREWYKPHMERMYEHVHMRIGDLDQLELLSSQYPSRERFVTELTLDPPSATSDMAGPANHDEDFLVLSTVHSAKGMEWDHVYILNVVDGSFPNEFATGKAELVEEERRLLYVAMTRARNELTCVVPLRFQITSQPKTSDGHVYGGRSRFLTEKVIKCFDEQTFQGSNTDVKIEEASADSGTIDVASRLKQMW
jgi:DNA-binding HxlR family transcriptional regulator